MRQIIYYKNYFQDFFDTKNEKVKEKIDQVLFLITIAERIPVKFFSHMAGTNGLYEIRIEYVSNIYRIFCCFDEGKIVVILMAFRKKARRHPRKKLTKH